MKENNNNQEKIDRMMSFLNPEGKFAFTVLSEFALLKKRSDREHDKLVSKYRKQLMNSIIGYLNHSIGDQHKDFLKVPVFYKGEKHEPLLEHLINQALDIGVDDKNFTYVLLGPIFCDVKVEDLIPSFFNNFDGIFVCCKQISRHWLGVAKISCHDDFLKENGLVSVSFDASGFILDKSTSS